MMPPAVEDVASVHLGFAIHQSHAKDSRFGEVHGRVDRTVIGLEEGSTAFRFPVSLARQNNVAWYEASDNVDADIHCAPTRNAVMSQGDTDGGVRVAFYKRLRLVD